MASRRGYVTAAEINALTSSAIPAATDDQISEAEELIDAYVGYQERFIDAIYRGEVTVGSTTSIIYDTDGGTQLFVDDDYFAGCQLEIVSGALKGARGIIDSSDKDAKSVTMATVFASIPAVGTVFKISQLGKFPRQCDVSMNREGTLFVKSIPEAVKRATAYQVEFMSNQGAAFFSSDNLEMQSERIGNYAYERSGSNEPSQSAIVRMLAPKARAVLKGIKNSLGQIVVD